MKITEKIIMILLLCLPATWAGAEEKNGLVRDIASDGKVRSETTYRQGAKFGKETLYHDNGKVRFITGWNNDKREGLFEEYSETGVLREQGNYKNDEKEGVFKTWHWKTGKLVSVEHFVRGHEQGLYQSWNNDGKLNFEIMMFEGKEKYQGYFKKYDNGVLLDFSNWKKGELNGPFQEFWASGKKKVTGGYFEGQMHGVFEYYTDTGKIERRSSFKMGDKVGPETTWHANGKIHEKANFMEGVLHGKFELFDKDGKLLQRLAYKNGELDGSNVEYMLNGKPRLLIQYRLGKRRGATKVFFNDGSRACESIYKDDELHGERRCWYGSGKEGLVERWEHGILKSAVYKDTDGSVLEKGDYFEDGSLKPELSVP